MKKSIFKKSLIILILVGLFSSFTYADELSDISDSFLKSVQSVIYNYENKIKLLQDENTKLKQDIENLTRQLQDTLAKISTGTTLVVSTGSTNSAVNSISSVNTNIGISTGNEKYDKIIDLINKNKEQIFKENNLDSSGSTIGLFEFIEPSNFFISIDDGKNPTGVTAFRTKILYSYDNQFNFTVKGIFSFDTTVSLYITKFGKNPFANTKRIRIKNPEYKGKLLNDEQTVNNTSTTNSNTISSNTESTSTTTNVTLADIKKAYDKNKILDVLKLSNEYIKNNPNDIEVLKMRYRSFYILGKYNESLSEIQKIETLSGTLEKIIACDASVIAKVAKNVDLNKRYGDICKKK
ncbi:hypothetical protein KAZ01_03180 [Candidatus Gracilibacteria bacterium]|nr:hypothetical protein [Candidatus Gracilibacteria bacterium]